MLYGTFTVFMIFLSVMGILHMVVFEAYTYLIFPISTLVWGFYKFFKENDDEYCRRNNVDQSTSVGWLLGLEDDYGYGYGQYGQNTYYTGYGNKTTHYRNANSRPPATTKYCYQDPEYKKIVPRCRKNSMVTTEKVKLKEEQHNE